MGSGGEALSGLAGGWGGEVAGAQGTRRGGTLGRSSSGFLLLRRPTGFGSIQVTTVPTRQREGIGMGVCGGAEGWAHPEIFLGGLLRTSFPTKGSDAMAYAGEKRAESVGFWWRWGQPGPDGGRLPI